MEMGDFRKQPPDFPLPVDIPTAKTSDVPERDSLPQLELNVLSGAGDKVMDDATGHPDITPPTKRRPEVEATMSSLELSKEAATEAQTLSTASGDSQPGARQAERVEHHCGDSGEEAKETPPPLTNDGGDPPKPPIDKPVPAPAPDDKPKDNNNADHHTEIVEAQPAHDGESFALIEKMDVATIEEKVLNYLDRRCNDLTQQVLAGERLGSQETREMCLGLRVKMHRAAQEGNTNSVDECVRRFSELRTPEGTPIADGAEYSSLLYAEAAARGSVLANDELYGGLARERDRVAQMEVAANPRYLRNLRVWSAPFLAHAAKVFAREGFPAEHLIEEYAANPVLKLAHYVQYAQDCREGGAPPERIHQLEERIVDTYTLLSDDSASSICGHKLLSQLHDDNLRMAVFTRFEAAREAEVAAGGPPGISWEQYEEIWDGLLTTPPSAMSSESRKTVRRYAGTVDRAQVDGFVPLRIEAALAKGATPGEAVVLANSLAVEDVRSTGGGKDYLSLTREVDETLGKYAYRHAAVGDFEAARTFLGAMTSPYLTVQAIAKCMPHASTSHQRTYLQGESLQRMIHPELENHWQVLDAVHRGDADGLESAIRAFVSPSTTPYSNPSDSVGDDIFNSRYFYDGNILEQALKHIPQERALPFARELRERVSAQDEMAGPDEGKRQRDLRNRLSDTLVRLGDTDEVRQRYATALHDWPAVSGVRQLELASLRFVRRRPN